MCLPHVQRKREVVFVKLRTFVFGLVSELFPIRCRLSPVRLAVASAFTPG
jgi:hypothetical protein